VRKQIEDVSGPQNQPRSGAHLLGMTVLSHADTCTQE